MHLVELTVGDYSSDGHGKTADITYESSHKAEDVKAAHAAGVDVLATLHGQWIKKALKELCSEYEDNTISRQLKEALKASSLLVDFDACEGYMEVDSFAALYVGIAQLAKADLVMVRQRPETITIGGYGLFYD